MLYHYAISQQGRSHIESGLPCQDASASVRIHSARMDHDLVLAAAADGVGSCACPERGAAYAVHAYIDKMSTWLQDCDALTEERVSELSCRAYAEICQEIEHMAVEEEMPYSQYDSTLCCGVYDAATLDLYYSQVGDSGMVAIYTDGTYEMVTERQSGELAHSLFPLRDRSHWVFGKASLPVAAFCIMTDGILDSCVGSKCFHNRVEYSRVIGPALVDNVMHSDEDAAEMRDAFSQYLMEEGDYAPYLFRTGSQGHPPVTDDLTLIVVQNEEAIAALPPIPFDQQAFDEETARIHKEIQDALAARARENAEAFNRSQAAKRAAALQRRATGRNRPGGARCVPKQVTAAGAAPACAHQAEQTSKVPIKEPSADTTSGPVPIPYSPDNYDVAYSDKEALAKEIAADLAECLVEGSFRLGRMVGQTLDKTLDKTLEKTADIVSQRMNDRSNQRLDDSTSGILSPTCHPICNQQEVTDN